MKIKAPAFVLTIFTVLMFLGWYGGLNYLERSAFTAFYVGLSLSFSSLFGFIIYDISKESSYE